MSEEKTKIYLGDVLISGEDINIDATPTSGSSNAVSSGGTYTAIQNAIEKSIAIYDVEDNGSTTAGTWLGKSSEITSLYDGLTIRYKVTVAGASTTKLNVNGLGAKIVYRNGSTKLTTNYAVGSYIFLYYSSLNKGSWIVYSDYDANSYAYVRQYQAGDNAAGTAPKYPLLARYNVTNKNGSYDTAYSRYHTGATLDTSTGELEATSFVKSGGTSSQFLKADGSVDSNAYATTSALGNYLPLAGGQMNQGSVIKWTDYSQLSSSRLQIPGAILEYGSLKLVESSEGESGGLSLDDSHLYAKHGSKTFTFPNTSGTLALTSAIPTVDATPTSGSSNAVSSGGVYNAINSALTSVLKYKGTIGTGGTVTSLPANHSVGDVYVVSTAGTYAGKACEVGDYIVCKTAGTSANDTHWDVINGENQVENKSASLAAAGSTATIATVDGTNITVTTPSSWVMTDTKNTAGATDTSSKIFLVGATAQTANPQTYSDNEVYTTSGVLTTKSVQVGIGAATMQYNSTDKSIEFIFA